MARMGIRTRRALKSHWRAGHTSGGYVPSGGASGGDTGCLITFAVIIFILCMIGAMSH